MGVGVQLRMAERCEVTGMYIYLDINVCDSGGGSLRPSEQLRNRAEGVVTGDGEVEIGQQMPDTA